jgi:hypothetical protein
MVVASLLSSRPFGGVAFHPCVQSISCSFSLMIEGYKAFVHQTVKYEHCLDLESHRATLPRLHTHKIEYADHLARMPDIRIIDVIGRCRTRSFETITVLVRRPALVALPRPPPNFATLTRLLTSLVQSHYMKSLCNQSLLYYRSHRTRFSLPIFTSPSSPTHNGQRQPPSMPKPLYPPTHLPRARHRPSWRRLKPTTLLPRHDLLQQETRPHRRLLPRTLEERARRLDHAG